MRDLGDERAGRGGFTLVELLITIVVVGILAAVAIVGLGGLVDNGSKAACQASMDAAKAAATTHRANAGVYPQTFDAMTNTNPQELEVPAGVSKTATTLKKGTSWTLTLTANGPGNVTTFACS